MFFDAESMELLAEIGAIELLQQKTAEGLREEAAARRAAREEQRAARERPGRARSEPIGFGRTRTSEYGDEDSAGSAAQEALERAQRSLGTRRGSKPGLAPDEAREAFERAQRSLRPRASNVVAFSGRNPDLGR